MANPGDFEFPAPPPQDISKLKAVVDGDHLGATVSFTIVSTKNAGSAQLLRSFTNSVKAATKIFQVFPIKIGDYLFDDRDASIVGKRVYYWIRLIGIDHDTDVGPVTLVVTPPAPPPGPAWLEVSAEALDPLFGIAVHVSMDVPAGDSSEGVAVFLQNYLGNAAFVEIAQDLTHTVSFHLQPTGEIVTFKAASVNAAGDFSAFSATAALTLNGVATPPNRLTDVIAFEGNGFTEVQFSAGSEADISGYQLWRSAFGAGFGAAALVTTIIPTGESKYAIEDPGHVNGGVNTYDWYVVAVNPEGSSTPSSAVHPASPW